MSNLAYGTFTITNLSAVTSVDVYYYNSTSSTSLSGGSWSTNTPTWTNGKYIWSKTVTTWEQGVTTQSEPVCITGQKGSTGAAGQSVTKITQQYALGSNSTTAPTTGWSTTMPTFESGKFYWTRSEIVWANPTSTTYTTAVLANGITSANTNAETAKTDAASAVSTANTANQTANTANQTANTANQTAQNAVSIANGKNTIYYSSSKPTGGTYRAGDTWFFLTDDGYRIYEYDTTSSDWVQKSMDGKSITAGTVTAAQIQAGAITTNKLATDAIKSTNYQAGTAPYSGAGTFLDLSNGNIYSPNFGINNTNDNITDGAYIKGSIYAYNGTIGQSNTNYWYIGNYRGYDQQPSAYIKGNGTATIQLGSSSTWRLNTNRIHTAWNDDSNSGNAYRLHYPVFEDKYWDMGIHVPNSKTDKFLYIRSSDPDNAAISNSNTLENLSNDINDAIGDYWNYQFYVTSEGNLYAKNLYILDDNGGITQIAGTSAPYLLKSGGDISGNLTIGGTLKVSSNILNKNGSNITLQTSLTSTTAATLTGNSTSPISIGVTGTLPTSNGGTGNTSYNAGGVVYADGSSPKKLLSTVAGTSGYLLKSGGTGAPSWIDPGTLTVAAATKATQDGDGNVIKTTYLKLTGGNVTGPVSFGDSVSIDDLNAGTLIVTGNSSFTNNAQFNTINGVTVGSNPKFTDTTYTFDNGYNASNNKGATVLTVTNAISALNVNPINGATNKTLTSISETAGKISATYSNINITKSQVSDFPASMPASDVSAWAKASTKPSYHFNEIQPLNTKTYNNIVMTANNDPNGWVYFAKILPSSFADLIYVKYRIRAEAAGTTNSYNDSIVEYWIHKSTVRGYSIYNKIKHPDYRAFYNHSLYRAKEAGITNDYGHLLGIRFTSSWNPATAANARTVTIDILEIENCTITFFDSMIKYADAPGTGSTNYDGRSDYDGTTQGINISGDRNDVNYYNRTNYSSRTTSAALYRYQFCLTKSDGTLVPVNSVNNNVTTSKTLTIDSFDPFGEIFYWNSTSTYAANAIVGNGGLYRQYLTDLRYSFNCGGYDTTPTLTARMPLYLVATPQADGTAKLYIEPLSMYLPSSEDGLIYIYLGRVYEDTKPYRVALSFNHPIYEYRNGAVRLYTGLKSETAVLDGTNVSLVTTGQKYLWNSKTNNTGTVTSVAASGSGGITISGSPITTSGTLAIGLNLSTAINGLGEGASPATRNDYIVAQYAGGGTTTTTYHRRKLSNIFAALSADDIPSLAWSKITSGNDDLKAIENLTGTTGLLKKTAANTWTLDTSAYVTSSGVTSITLTQGTGISIGSSGTAITSTGTRTISLADNYGDTKNPYASKTARYVLAAPAAANGVPSFRALTKEDVGLNNVLNYGQVTAIGQGDNGTLRVWTGDPTSTSTDDYEDIAITITAYNQSTVSKAGALNLSAAVGSTSKPVYFKADGKPYEISYTIEKSVPSNAVFTDTWNKVSTSQDGYVTKLPGNTTTFLRGDGSWGTPIGTTYTFDGTYNASSNKAATVSTVTNAINALDGNLNNTTPGAGKTLTAFSQTNGKISATFGDISITKSQITDFPSTLTPAAHTHGNISNTGTITSTTVALGNGDNLLFADSSNNGKIERSSITIGTGTSKYLRQDGTWGTPAGTYSLPVATDSVRGGVKIGYSSSGKNYAVQLSSEKMYVNVPWTDTTYSAGTGLSLSGTTFSNSGVTGVKGNKESSYHTGQVNLTPANIGAFESLSYQRGTTEVGVRPLVDQARANRLAFLPADQIIIEKTTDGGTTWEDAEISDDQKRSLFVNGANIYIPLLNGAKSTQCGIRITITGMKYDVPQNTSETQKYNYWNDNYIKSQERCFNVREWWFWISANNDTIKPEIYCSTGANPNNWSTVFNTDFGMTGWRGSNWIRAGDGKTFGGSITQTGNYWNWRLIFWSKFADGKTAFNSAYTQVIQTIKCYGDSVWTGGNNLAARDHLYSWDNNQNATFPAKVTATEFIGNLAWSKITNKPTTLSGYGITDSILKWQTSTTAATNVYDFGVYVAQGTGGATGPTNENYYAMLNIPYRKAFGNTKADYSWSIAGSTSNDKRLFYRTSSADTWGDWVEIAHINVGTAVGNATQPVYVTNTGEVTACTSYANASVNHATSADSATSATKIGTSGIWLYANNNNEINFGGTNNGTNIYIGYRATDSRPIPTKFIFGSSTGTADLQAKTIYLGSGTTSYITDTQYTGNAATATTATKATQDGSGNIITTKYVTFDTEQTISGRKTFQNLATTTFKGSTESEYCNINYNQTLNALVFSFG